MQCTAGITTDGNVSWKVSDLMKVNQEMQWHTLDYNLAPEYSILLCCKFRNISIIYIQTTACTIRENNDAVQG